MKRRELQGMLASRGLRPNQRFGQNFLVDPALLQAIPQDAKVQAGDAVLEIGPGAGALTAALLAVGAQVFAVELDHGLFAWLEESFADALDSGQLQLVQGDALGKDPLLHPKVEEWWAKYSQAKVVANLPYSISGPFLGRLPGRSMQGACLLLQKEMAEKAVGATGKSVGPLSIRLALSFHAQMGRRLPPEVFWPRPKVDSAFLHLQPRADAPSQAEQTLLKEMLSGAFQQRRKKVLPRLRSAYPLAADALTAQGVASDDRPETVSPALWLAAVRAQLLA
jgi:16S rRNA (adenine1518-N6/adenine1519-N6)-dimethyltransferase